MYIYIYIYTYPYKAAAEIGAAQAYIGAETWKKEHEQNKK